MSDQAERPSPRSSPALQLGQTPQASIIVTAYNIESYIEESLASIAAQTLAELEVIVVDDGSSDATPARITEFCAGDPRFIPVLLPHNSPGGVATAANIGLERASSPWVGFVDGDDFIEPTMFERLVGAAAASGSDLAMCEYLEVIDGSGERRDPADAHRWAEFGAGRYELDTHTRYQLLRFIAVPWRKLYRRTLLADNQIRFPVSEGFYEDNPFHWFTLLCADSIALVPEVLCYHRVARTGQTTSAADERLLQIFDHHDTIHTWLLGRGLLDAYQVPLLIWVISQLEWIARRISPSTRRQLFAILRPIFAQYSTEMVLVALREGNKGATARRLSLAIAKGEYGSFVRALSSRSDSNSPVLAAAFHLRHSGVRHTVLLTGRYLRNRLLGDQAGRALGRFGLFGRLGREASRQDVLFGLMVIQRQLAGLEESIGVVEARLDAIDRRIEGRGTDRETTSGAVDVDAQRGDPAA